MSTETKRLYRSRKQRMVGGLCGGLGEFLGMDATVVRLIVVLITIFWPFTILAYLILMLVVPEEPAAEKPAEIVEMDDQPQ
jgi:phage shock protein C